MPNADHATVLLATAAGSPAVLRVARRPRRAPGPGEVEVEVRAVAVTPRDVRLRAGRPQPGEPPAAFPWTPGSDLVGVVRRVGPGVADLGPGTRVAGIAPGACASHVTAPAAAFVAVPDGLDDRPLAATIGPAASAWQALELAGDLPRRRVLVTHATSAIGRAAVQLAADRRARVVAVAGDDRLDELTALGAGETIDERLVPYAAVATQADVVVTQVDEPGPLHEHHPMHQALAATDRRGLLLSLASPPPEDAAGKQVRAPRVPPPGREALQAAVLLLAEGIVRPTLDAGPPIDDPRDAHAYVEHRGDAGGTIVIAPPTERTP
ncbi:alcohol dehydrogenase catalytic domain-containing protein [Patulibacter defluvii]|uniref:alcohol dehydrogenase catalytic domain-containing protein n=1 Tax=Patulibacter defluvii TaxID=3095358 RepID=UPI002A75AD7D|nr:alcohol dehydrogenase catalytic domain-containing protein [Patulibacter sp. DM4]